MIENEWRVYSCDNKDCPQGKMKLKRVIAHSTPNISGEPTVWCPQCSVPMSASQVVSLNEAKLLLGIPWYEPKEEEKKATIKQGLYLCLVTCFGDPGYTDEEVRIMLCHRNVNDFVPAGAVPRYWCGMEVLEFIPLNNNLPAGWQDRLTKPIGG
jgi:hypothetical protein